MGKSESYTCGLLKIDINENNNCINIKWTGRSIDRKPSTFITPILVSVLNRSSDCNKRLVLDFRKLEYVNSSTITPIIKVLERAKRGTNQVTVLYEKSLKWQDLSFSALRIFQTGDQRVEIKGL